jgi:hypothetical protein
MSCVYIINKKNKNKNLKKRRRRRRRRRRRASCGLLGFSLFF